MRKIFTLIVATLCSAAMFAAPDGAINGKFSVSADKQVYFSQGNLQYQWYYGDWSFAEHQWDVIGADNANITDPNYQGYIDLFGWGTSGYDGKTPQTATTMSSDYGPATGDIAGTRYDWGSVAESMDLDTTWRTLTKEEWDYLLNTRTNAANLRTKYLVHGVGGLILLPDNWDLDARPLSAISDDTWATWESLGAVFLPSTGYRSGTTVTNVSTEANYWTSTRYESDATNAYHLYVPSSGTLQIGHSKIYYGMAVRLVIDVQQKPDMLNGKFTVADGKRIQFSKGNLQYHCKNHAWQFAAEQTDYIGEDNSDKSDTYDGWIDLFGWGTGNQPNWRTTNDNDYPAFVDWGTKIGEPDEWRTLTAGEWEYLFISRTDAATLFGFGTVDGIKGLIILPDNWELPEGASFTASTTQGLEIDGHNYSNPNDNNFEHNTYTFEQWSVMEAAGAVFLPVAGRRDGQTATVSKYGYYWSSTADDPGARYLFFDSKDFNPYAYYQRHFGMAVRLVQDYVEPKPDTLSGKFSIAADKQIQFSKGNLQYHCKDQVWQFATNQWDTIGGANTNIAADYDGWIDFFGWGTANNPTLTSVTTEDYSTFTDWGIKMGEPDEWRTLTDEETEYLLYTRSKTLFGMGKVNNVKGLIILPDDWTDPKPNDVSFEPSTAHGLNDEGYGAYSNNGGTDNFIWNDYTKEDWEAMEAAGAVFLPAAGYRKSPEAGAPTTEVVDVNVMGVYWTSIPTGNQAYALWFSKIVLKSRWYFARGYGFPVRLVHDVPAAPEAIDNTPFPSGDGRGEAHKRIVNGQLLIERDGKVFNAQGIEIK